MPRLWRNPPRNVGKTRKYHRSLPGAQTERRAGGGLLGGSDLTGRFFVTASRDQEPGIIQPTRLDLFVLRTPLGGFLGLAPSVIKLHEPLLGFL